MGGGGSKQAPGSGLRQGLVCVLRIEVTNGLGLLCRRPTCSGTAGAFRQSGGLLNASIQPTPCGAPPFDRASLPFVAIAIRNDAIIIGGAARAGHDHQQRAQKQNSHFASIFEPVRGRHGLRAI